MFHEFGHFLAARAVGIRVEEFAFGFGPKLVRLFKRGDTEYTIHPFPLGGFVKLAGMEPGEEDVRDGFQAQAAWKRALVIFAGPFASFVLAVLVFLMVGLYFGFPDLSKPANRVGMVNPNTEAKRIDLRAGDRILSIAGTPITKGRQMTDLIHSRPGQRVRLEIERDGRKMVKTGVPQYAITYLGASWSYMQTEHAKVQGVMPDSAAKKAGIKTDDELVSINGRRVVGGAEMVEAIKANAGKPITLGLIRAGKPVTVTAHPEVGWVRFAGTKWVFPGGYAEDGNGEIKQGDQLVSVNGVKVKSGSMLYEYVKTHPGEKLQLAIKRQDEPEHVSVSMKLTARAAKTAQEGYYDAIGLLGFLPEPALVRVGFGEAVTRGLSDTWDRAGYLVKALTSEQIKKDVGGPLMIGKVTASAVALGPYWVLTTLAGLSLSLAFINLVPIPLLDGGLIAVIAFESIRRKRLTRSQMQAFQMVGLAVIAMLFVVIMFSDITKLLGGQVPQ